MSLRSQFESILVPKKVSQLVEYTLQFSILRYATGATTAVSIPVSLPAVPGWFTIYEIKLLLWNELKRDPIYAPPLLFMCVHSLEHYEPLEIAWSTLSNEPMELTDPISRMTGDADERFIDSSGREKPVNQNNRTRMTLNDVFELDTRTSELPVIEVFVYADCIDRIVAPRPLGERDAYGRIIPYFPFLDASNLPTSSSTLPTLPVLMSQTDQVVATLAQVNYLDTLLPTISGNASKVPRLEGIQLLRWVWDKVPEAWEGSALIFFGTKVTADRPYMRLYPSTGQPLVKVLVKGLKDRPIPDIADSRLFTSWKEEKVMPSGKDCLYVKLRMNKETSLYSTMRIFNDGTADLIIQPPKRKRILDPYSEVGEAPTLLEAVFLDMPYRDLVPRIAQVSAIFKLYKQKTDFRLTQAGIRSKLKAFSSLFQEIPPLPNEQPLVMLRFKGVSNFTNETRIFSFLTQNAENDMLEGESDDEGLIDKVVNEFKVSKDEARKQIAAWITQRGEFTLAVSDTKDYILNKNPGVDIAVYEQHPVYTFHMYSDQNSKTYSLILHLLGILMELPTESFTSKRATAPFKAISMSVGGSGILPAASATSAATAESPTPPDSPDGYETGAYPDFLMGIPEETTETSEAPEASEVPEAKEEIEVKEQAAREVAFEQPSDVNTIKLTQYYIERLALVDPSLFNYEKPAGGRGYVSHCAANEGRQPIVLDSFEFEQLKAAYASDTGEGGDMEILVYPEDMERGKRLAKEYSQPTSQDDERGVIDGKPFPSPTNKEIITIIRYGSKKDKVKYYLCPRLFCIRDRILVRYKDFKGTVDKEGNPKPAFTCPFISSQGSPCRGTLLSKDDVKHDRREGNKTILQRVTTRDSDKKRSIFAGFLSKQKTPDGLYLPCCFTDETDKTLFKKQDPELTRLGLIQAVKAPVEPLAQPLADSLMAAGERALKVSKAVLPIDEKYEPNYFRVLQGVSVKSLVDASKIPLMIVPPRIDPTKPVKEQKSDPKAGPQIGFLPQVLDEYFLQDSKSDRFAERDIIKLLKPTAQGFLRIAIDNSNPNQSVLSAIAAYNYLPNVRKLIELIFDNPKFTIFQSIPPKKFIEINGGNLVHEFYGRYTFDPVIDLEDPIASKYINMNDMRKWASDNLSIRELSSANIPAIERIMNSYRCFTTYILKLKEDPSVRADLRTFYDILCEPSIMLNRGLLFIVLELTVEDIIIKTDKSEFKTEVKFDRVRCPSYPLNEKQQQADIAFLIHYTRITKDRTKPSGKSYSHMAWEPLFYVDGYVDGIHKVPDGRHRPTFFFQRSEEKIWPPIVKQRVTEFFEQCTSVNRGPFTSMFTIHPNALIGSNELINAVRMMPSGKLRDSYNHFVGITYKISGYGIAVVPIMDDGSKYDSGKLYLDWDDFKPAPVDKIVEFYRSQIINIFPQYKGYEPKYIAKSRLSGMVEGLMLENDILIPATEPVERDILKELDVTMIDEIEWNINNTIAYDIQMRKTAFEHAKVGQNPKDTASIITDPKDKDYLKLNYEGSEDDIEDIYQHLRLSFSNWLDSEAGREIRSRLEPLLKSTHISLYDKRKQVDILLYSTIIQWLEPNAGDQGDIGFLRVDCLVQGKESCSGRCKWVPNRDAGVEGIEAGSCKIHMPKPTATVMHFPKVLYIRLIDELIRYTSKRNEIFDKSVPRLTVRRDAQRQGDQYIIPEGTSAWKTWWEHLRSDWLTPDQEEYVHFDEQYEPIPTGLAVGDPLDTRTLPQTLVDLFGVTDPKTSTLVWNPATIAEEPFYFLRSVIRNDSITGKQEPSLDPTEVKTISIAANVQVLYIKNDTSGFSGAIRSKVPGATRAIIIVTVDGVPGWISQKGAYDVKIPFSALPAALHMLK